MSPFQTEGIQHYQKTTIFYNIFLFDPLILWYLTPWKA